MPSTHFLDDPGQIAGPLPQQVSGSVASRLTDAAIRTVAYADVFDFPLTAPEIHRYLIQETAGLSDLERVLANGALDSGRLSQRGGYYSLPGREWTVETRIERERRSVHIWPDALRYGLRIARIPLVRMVAVTGDLAVNNVRRGADIDYLIVTRPGRLWLSRLLIIALVRAASVRGVTICPNFILSENALVIPDQNLYTAHELVQMVCVCGWRTYIRMRQANAWVARFLPNAGIDDLPREEAEAGMLYTAAEAVLESRPLAWLEDWEMQRKIRKFRSEGQDNPEVRFSPDFCKGHFDGHAQRTLDAYSRRVTGSERDRP
jgi:hypothetical protein